MEVGKSWLGSRSAVGRSVGDTGRQQIRRVCGAIKSEMAGVVLHDVSFRSKDTAGISTTVTTLRFSCSSYMLPVLSANTPSLEEHARPLEAVGHVRALRACDAFGAINVRTSGMESKAQTRSQLGSQSVPWLLTGQVWSSILVPAKCAATCDCRTRRGSLQLGGGAEDSHNIACGRM